MALRDEAVRVMADGGTRLCEDARRKWRSGAYGNDADMRRENLARWHEIENEIARIAKELREGTK